MPEPPFAFVENRLPDAFQAKGSDPERKLKNFCYVVGSVNESALSVWAELWQQLRPCITTNGLITPEMEQGFKPSCGWAEFLEKFWLLKHYLDYIHRFCQ